MAPKSDTLIPNSGSVHPPRKDKSPSPALPGKTQIRKPGVEWNHTDDFDDGQDEALDVDEEEKDDHVKTGEAVEKRSPSGGQVIDLLDIARPAKQRGVAKEFEVIQGSPRTIALPDEPPVPAVKEEDWEEIDDSEQIVYPRQSYSAVVRQDDDDKARD